jgi:hypothetical protein
MSPKSVIPVSVLLEDPTQIILSIITRYHNVLMIKEHIAILILQPRRG